MNAVHVLLASAIMIVAILWLNLKSHGNRDILTDKVNNVYDYIIVGGGSAGSVLASRLSEDEGTSVLLLEAGGFFDENPNFDVPAYWPTLLKSDSVWDYYSTSQAYSHLGMFDRKAYLPRGRVLGGTSMINAMTYTRGSRFDFDDWASSGCKGWSYEDILPYFIKSEDIQIPELKDSLYHGSGGPLSVSSGRITKLADIYLQAGQELGYNITDYNGAIQEGFCEIQLTTKKGVRASTSATFLGNTEGRKNLDISVNSFVTQIDIDSNSAVGVTYIKNGQKHKVRVAKEVIISAGAINTPQILMLSGIGPHAHLSEHGIPVKANLPVGKNLQDQPLIILSYKIKEPIGINSEKLTSLWSDIQYTVFGDGPKSVSNSEAMAFLHIDSKTVGKKHPDLQFMFNSFLIDADFQNLKDEIANEYLAQSFKLHGITTILAVTRPKSTGEVKLKSTDPFDYPNIDLQYFSKKDDVTKMIAGIRIWEKFTQTKAMKDIGVDINEMKMSFCAQHKYRSDEYWECFIRHVASSFSHHSGSCKMGAFDDPTAVVDPELRVKGIKGLRVVDTSIFPTITSGNTNAPAIMAAEKAADLIRGIDTVKHLKQKP